MQNKKTLKMAQMAILIAITLVMAFTPLGYLKIGPALEVTFITIPIALAAMLGVRQGAILGTVFGLTSFYQCFGLSAFGAALLSINPVLTAITCIVPRLLMGLLCGYIFKAVKKIDKTNFLVYPITCISAALLNTLFFIVCLWVCFGKSEFILNLTGGSSNIFVAFSVLAGVNALVEAAVCCVIGGAIAKAADAIFAKQQ